MSDLWIDINSDLGESEESLANGTDFESDAVYHVGQHRMRRPCR